MSRKADNTPPDIGAPRPPDGSATPEPAPGGPVLIIGPGDSAGGLGALEGVIAGLPTAGSVVVSLDPDRDRELAALLGRTAPRPVTRVTGRTRIEKGHVYITPPDVTLRIEAGYIHLEPERRDADLRATEIDESDEQLQLALRAADAGLWEWDFAAGVQRWSPETFALFGIPPTPGGLTPLDDPPTIRDEDREHLARLRAEAVARGDASWAVEFRVAHPERGDGWLAMRGRFHYAPDGTPTLLRGIAFNVSERRLAEEALRESEQRYRLLVEAATAYAIITTEPDGTITTWGPGAEVICGWTPEEAIGQNDAIIFTDADRADGAPERERATAVRAGQAIDERWHVRNDGTTFWGSGVMAALWRSDGSLGGFVKLFRDATEQKRAEEALQASAARALFRAAFTDAIRPIVTADDAQAEAVRQLGTFLHASRAFYTVVEPDGVHAVIERDYHDGVPSVAGTHVLGSYDARAAGAYHAGQTLVQPDVQSATTLTPEARARYAGIHVGAFVSVPLVKDGRLAALVTVHQATARAWTPEETALIEETAERTWSAVERRRGEQWDPLESTCRHASLSIL